MVPIQSKETYNTYVVLTLQQLSRVASRTCDAYMNNTYVTLEFQKQHSYI